MCGPPGACGRLFRPGIRWVGKNVNNDEIVNLEGGGQEEVGGGGVRESSCKVYVFSTD